MGLDNFAPWAADLVQAGHVLVRREGRFSLLDLSQQPSAFAAGDGFNRSFIAGMLLENESADHALRDMLTTHGAVYLADLEPILLLQPPLHSFFLNQTGFDSLCSQIPT